MVVNRLYPSSKRQHLSVLVIYLIHFLYIYIFFFFLLSGRKGLILRNKSEVYYQTFDVFDKFCIMLIGGEYLSKSYIVLVIFIYNLHIKKNILQKDQDLFKVQLL